MFSYSGFLSDDFKVHSKDRNFPSSGKIPSIATGAQRNLQFRCHWLTEAFVISQEKLRSCLQFERLGGFLFRFFIR